MTSTATENPTPPTFVQPRPRRSGARIAIIAIGGGGATIGVVLAHPRPGGGGAGIPITARGGVTAPIGVVLPMGGGPLMPIFGSDGVLQSGRHTLSTPTAALVSEPAVIEDTSDFSDVVGDTRIRVS